MARGSRRAGARRPLCRGGPSSAVPVDRGHCQPPPESRATGFDQPRNRLVAKHSRACPRPVHGNRETGRAQPVRPPSGRRGRLARSAHCLFRFCARRELAGMSELAIHPSEASNATFRRGTMLMITAIGTLAFIAMLVLGAYAPDLRSGKNGGAHALSNAAIGFSGLVRLAEATGREPKIIRSEDQLEDEDLAVIAPGPGSVNGTIFMDRRGPRWTLLVVPKWAAYPDRQKPGWVRVAVLRPAGDPERILAPSVPIKVARSKTRNEPLVAADSAPAAMAFLAPRITQTISGGDLHPVITDQSGRIVLGQVGDRNLFILADPDLINNHGMGDPRQARAALAMLDYLNSTGSTSVLFDVTSNGLGSSRSPLKLAFDPPFLAVTLTIFAAMLLAGVPAPVPFGSPRAPGRAHPLGQTAP